MGGYANFEDKPKRTSQNKHELVLLCVFLLSLVFVREYAVFVMLFIIIPAILTLEYTYKNEIVGVM